MKLNHFIDHTLVKPAVTMAEIDILCKEALEYQFAAVCVPPHFVKQCKIFLNGSAVKVSTVIGFPFGYSAIEAKLAEILLSIVDEADELEVVINYTAIKNNDWQYISNEINHIVPIVKNSGKCLKIIIESGILNQDELEKCCKIYGIAQVDFLTTSTGFSENGATVETIKTMREQLPEAVKIKASGNIVSYEFAKQLVDAGASRLGCGAGVEIVKKQISSL